MNNTNTQLLFLCLVFINIQTVGKVNPYLKVYNSTTFLKFMNTLEINYVSNWENNLFLNYINIIYKDDINVAINKIFFL